jgi:hypothetical protein
MKKSLFTILCTILLVTTAYADWREGDPYKMEQPQLPNPDGWDIDMINYTLADDWICSQTGDVTDIHFWYSVEYDTGQYPPPHIGTVNVSIHDDIPAGTGGINYSRPGTLRWSGTFNNFVTAGPWDGLQGWDDPHPAEIKPVCREDDHNRYWQVNITDIDNPFRQEIGKIYWLDLNVTFAAGSDHLVGWKTTYNVSNDAAVYATPGGAVPWVPVAVCQDDAQTDFAFVITPEPATVAILGLGRLFLFRKKR